KNNLSYIASSYRQLRCKKQVTNYLKFQVLLTRLPQTPAGRFLVISRGNYPPHGDVKHGY
ncbi:TPA: hypothetical protein ACIJR0_004621, partial [Klebsiella aerogenes]